MAFMPDRRAWLSTVNTVISEEIAVRPPHSPLAGSGTALSHACSVIAAVHTRYGPPAVVQLAEVKKPTAEDNHLLIKVHATTVNRTDCATRAGVPFFARLVTGFTKPKMTILGNEFAGEVKAIGPDVASFVVGDRVFGYSEGPFGAHAEFMSVPEDSSVATMPLDCSFDEIAAATEGSHYALGWIRKVELGSGRRVLVNGATGAIGSAVVQLANSPGGIGDRSVRHREHGTGEGPRRPQNHRLHHQ